VSLFVLESMLVLPEVLGALDPPAALESLFWLLCFDEVEPLLD
jgi:hypothetical protein